MKLKDERKADGVVSVGSLKYGDAFYVESDPDLDEGVYLVIDQGNHVVDTGRTAVVRFEWREDSEIVIPVLVSFDPSVRVVPVELSVVVTGRRQDV